MLLQAVQGGSLDSHDDSCYWTHRQVMLYGTRQRDRGAVERENGVAGRVVGKGIVVTGAGSTS
jgi:hypothetical protein